MASNYDDVLGQLLAAGLVVDHLDIGRMRRCKVDGDREKRGWYHLHEIRLPTGDDLIVGSYGIWRGAENNATKVDVRKSELTREQADSLRKRLAEDKKRAELARKADGERAAAKATKAWRQCTPDGDCDYLHKKGVGAHGVRFSPQGAMVIPMLDASNQVHGLQIIRGKAKPGERRRLDKEYWPAGLIKKGHFHWIGGVPDGVILLAEGYATGATLFEATTLPVAVAFDAGNLAPVAEALRKRYKTAKILICADDDTFSEGNPGVTAASAAAMQVGGAYVAPAFADEPARRLAFDTKGQKLSDFNDLFALEGLQAVRGQVSARLLALGWHASRAVRATAPEGGGAAQNEPLRPIDSLDELLERFCLVYGQGGTVFDHQEHCLLALSDMRDACLDRGIHRAWSDHPDKRLVRVREVGFDPACTDPEILCNLWSGWPTEPKAGNCEYLLDLLRYMCNDEALFQWVLKWLAYPIQNPGAKMKTTLVVHGPQGTGKNMFFDAYMAIFGKYGRMVDQAAIEDKFNDWASGLLFVQFDEVVARSEMYHIKNKLKSFITGDRIRINPKGRAAYEERNHVNAVFLSNEAMPVVLEEDDRRHAVIWTPEKLSPDFYRDTMREVLAGGVAALHHHLLHLDVGEFTNSSQPPMTAAKRELIDLSLDSPSRFIVAMERGDVEGLPGLTSPKLLSPCLSMDLFDLYQEWCRRLGLKALHQPRFVNALARKHGAQVQRKRYDSDAGTKGPAGVIYLKGGHEPPTGGGETQWLGERIDVFKVAMRDYKAIAGFRS
jgi:putative DNA primase/helicase